MKRFYAFPAFLIAVLVITAAFSKKQTPTKATDVQTAMAEQMINGSPVVFHQVVQLETENEVNPIDSDAQGLAILRITADKILYAKVIVQKLEEDDGTLTAAHIHTGEEGEPGPVLVGLVSGEENFGKNHKIQLTDQQYDIIVNGSQPLYVNAHSTVYGPGIVRGQIR
jgi:hypothetical protein